MRMPNHCSSYGGAVEKCFLDSFVSSGEYITLVDLRGGEFHGYIIRYDNLSLLLGTRKEGVPPILFNKQDISAIQANDTKFIRTKVKTKAKHFKA